MPKVSNQRDMRKMQADTDLHVLVEAQKIKIDPARYKAAMQVHTKKLGEMQALAAANPAGKQKAAVGHGTKKNAVAKGTAFAGDSKGGKFGNNK